MNQEEGKRLLKEAREYIERWKKEKEEVKIKRAKYWLRRAIEVEEENKLELMIEIARCEKELKEYGKGYETIKEAEKYIEGTGRELKKEYYELRGEMAEINGKNKEAVEGYNKAMELGGSEEERARIFSKTIKALERMSITTEELVMNNLEYKKMFRKEKEYEEYRNFKEIVRNKRRIRVGYVSGKYKRDENFSLIYGLIACHDRDYFEVTAYAMNEEEDVFTEAIKPVVEHYERVGGMKVEEIAEKIHKEEIDILVDLDGHREGTGLAVFGYRPSPIQISGIGAGATSGLETMNYFITDKQTDPPGMHERYFTETLIYMQSQFCYASNADVPKPVEPPMLKNGYVTLGSFHRYNKIGDDMLEVWKEIMRRIPESRLLMVAEEYESDSLVDKAYERLKRLGFNMDQVTFKALDMNYMKEFLNVDISLDTYPISDVSRTLDSIFMGVPVVSYYSERRESRFGLTILENMGLKEYAVTTGDEYIERVERLARDKELLKVMHRELRNRMQQTNAIQPKHYVRVLEQCYEYIIRQYEK